MRYGLATRCDGPTRDHATRGATIQNAHAGKGILMTYRLMAGFDHCESMGICLSVSPTAVRLGSYDWPDKLQERRSVQYRASVFEGAPCSAMTGFPTLFDGFND